MDNILKPLKIDDIDLTKIIYNKIKSSEDRKIVYIKYENKYNDLVFQMPSLYIKENLEYHDKYTNISLNLLGKNESKIKTLLNFFNNLEEKVINDANLNKSKWFDNEDRKFENITNNKTLKLKILHSVNFETEIYLNDNKSNVRDIVKNSWIKCITQIFGISINKNNYCIILKPLLISVIPIKIVKYVLNESSSSENDDIQDTENSIFLKSYDDEITTQIDDNILLKNQLLNLNLNIDDNLSSTST
jgi:hypothetical protein